MDLIKCNSCNKIIDNEKSSVFSATYFPRGVQVEKPIRLNICMECANKTYGDNFKLELKKILGDEND